MGVTRFTLSTLLRFSRPGPEKSTGGARHATPYAVQPWRLWGVDRWGWIDGGCLDGTTPTRASGPATPSCGTRGSWRATRSTSGTPTIGMGWAALPLQPPSSPSSTHTRRRRRRRQRRFGKGRWRASRSSSTSTWLQKSRRTRSRSAGRRRTRRRSSTRRSARSASASEA